MVNFKFLLNWIKGNPKITGLLLTVIYLFPYYFFGENSSILIHDNLDSNIVWVKILLDNGLLLASPNFKILQILDGLPRASLMASIDISFLPFWIFDTFWGYVINKTIICIVAFSGMYLLLNRIVLRGEFRESVSVITAICFATLPFWGFTMIIAGVPYLFYAFFSIRNGVTNYSHWLIIILYPFTSSLVLTGIFILIIFSVILVCDFFLKRKFPVRIFFVILLLSFLYLISHYHIIYQTIFSTDYISHRKDLTVTNQSVSSFIHKLFIILFKGQSHAKSLQFFLIIPIVYYAFTLLKENKFDKLFVIIVIFIFSTSCLYAVYDSILFKYLLKYLVYILPIQWDRFYFLHPVLWYVLVGISVDQLLTRSIVSLKFLSILIVFQLVHIIYNHELIRNHGKPTFKEFFSENQFEEIKNEIGKSPESYKVVSFGIHPAISQFNGFYTIDGYCPNYPIEHKRQFRNVIKSELAKNDQLMSYFDNWGSRCYLFSSELGFSQDRYFSKENFLNNPFDANYQILKEMGVEFMISNTKITSLNSNAVKLRKVIKSENYYWVLYLYEIT